MGNLKLKLKNILFNNKNQNLKEKYADIDSAHFWDLYKLCKPFTMTSVERMFALYNATNYVLDNNIEGDFVECGVWRGGSAMMVAYILKNRNVLDRKIYLYDTYEGMSEPTEFDKTFDGSSAKNLLMQSKNKETAIIWCLASLEDVQQNLRLTGYTEDNIFYIKGKVEDTITSKSPIHNIALLRLDTDWYESTKHELEYYYPKLQKNGILIIDDFGHWEGCKKAVVEYFKKNNITMLLQRIDYTGRLAIKN
ncbi:MAG: class I SAM-dependent methyltransferase [Chitinophagaceae bacterium]|nr:class I SAM-dependent methyltransferase [Chitinophagaceae bacterium]